MMGRACLAAAMLIAATPAFACDDDQYSQDIPFGSICLPKVGGSQGADPVKLVINPLSMIDPTGIPKQTDFNEFVIRNPEAVIELAQQPQNWPYLPVAYGIISSRNAIVQGGNRIPDFVKAKLSCFYSVELMDSIRWKSDSNFLNNTFQAVQMYRDENTRAITLINGVVFRDAADAYDIPLWAHELVHAQQYRNWGVFDFARRWTNNSGPNGEVEAPAYQREAQVRSLPGMIGAPPPGGFPVQQGPPCGS